MVACVANFTPVVRRNHRVGVPLAGAWTELLNSDAPVYGGSGQGNLGRIETARKAMHGHPQSLSLTLPPLSILFLAPDDSA